jgi:hypothetical protein
MRRIIRFCKHQAAFRLVLRGGIAFPALVALLLLSAGCRNEQSTVIDPPLTAPYLFSFQLSVPAVNLDTSSAPAVIRLANRTYKIEDSLSVIVIDPTDGNNIVSCTYAVTSPLSSTPFMTGPLTRRHVSGNSAYFAAKIDFTLTRDQIGPYTVRVDASGQSLYAANARQSTLDITRNNARPVVANLLVPDTLTRPLTGALTVRFAISAADSDGPGDITKVFFKSVNSTSPDFEQPLFDDGQVSIDGDSLANDGRFARLLFLDSTATTGRKEFRFFARDKSGALSDSLIHFIVIQ